ncbi:MAG: GMC family oxidoreductase [Solirubrobacterales bacterium]|nr:GMC family oxidoreductase [Solirubrobacterales bacterium]MBV9474270.1 GMC family oxidoreductase [Solirubrobacterales bacterium]
MNEHFEVVVVGSGAGGGVVAGELAQRGRSVLLLEAGPHLTAANFVRWESKASHDLWWPLRFAFPVGDPGLGPVALIGGRCVGGSTTINTKVALRASQRELDKWHAASGLTGERGEPFNTADLEPHYDRVERYLGVRERTDWDWRECVRTARRGFEAVGASLEPVRAYTDENCMQCGSCLQGCPTNAGKSTLNTYIHRTWMSGALTLRANSLVDRVVIDDGADGPRANGVAYRDADGESRVVEADVVVVAGGSLNTPQLLLRSGVPNQMIGRTLGLHPAQFVFGLFDEPQDCHMVAPITSHCMDFAADDAGGFVVEAATIQDPIGFTVSLCDENGPMWGEPLVQAARRYRHWVGLLNMSNDENNGGVALDEDGNEHFTSDFQPVELERIKAAFEFSRRVLEAAGATRVLWSGLATTHMQGSCRMGADPATSVLDNHGESHEVKRLYVGDSSVFPRTLSVNPSLTIMALASRLAEHLDANASGYLQGARELVA